MPGFQSADTVALVVIPECMLGGAKVLNGSCYGTSDPSSDLPTNIFLSQLRPSPAKRTFCSTCRNSMWSPFKYFPGWWPPGAFPTRGLAVWAVYIDLILLLKSSLTFDGNVKTVLIKSLCVINSEGHNCFNTSITSLKGRKFQYFRNKSNLLLENPFNYAFTPKWISLCNCQRSCLRII